MRLWKKSIDIKKGKSYLAEQFRQITHLFWQNSMKEVLCNKQEVVRGEDLVTSTKESPSINVEGLFIRVCLFFFSPKLIVDLKFSGDPKSSSTSIPRVALPAEIVYSAFAFGPNILTWVHKQTIHNNYNMQYTVHIRYIIQ